MARMARYGVIKLSLISFLMPILTWYAKRKIKAWELSSEEMKILEQGENHYLGIEARHGRFVEINGIRLHYIDWGTPNGVPLIWTHGHSTSAHEMDEVATKLVEAGYRVIAIDVRSHGQSHCDDLNFSMQHIADDIVALMDSLGIEKAIIGGLSLGGQVSMVFYDQYPQRVLGLILADGGNMSFQECLEVDPPGIRNVLIQKLLGKLPASPATSRLQAMVPFAQIIKSSIQRELNVELASLIASTVKENKEGMWESCVRMGDTRYLGEPEQFNDPACLARLPLYGRSIRLIFAEISMRNLDVPTLIIEPRADGDKPRGNSTDQNNRLKAQHPEFIKIVVYPDTHHLAHYKRPQWFIRDAMLLLERIKSLHEIPPSESTSSGQGA